MFKSCLALEARPVLSTGKSFHRREVLGSVLLHSVDPSMIQGLLAFCTFVLTAVCDTLMFMLKLRQFRIGLRCRRVRCPLIVHYEDHVTTTPWPLMLDLHAHRRVLNDVGKFGRPWNSEGQRPSSLMVVVVVYTCSGTDSWRRRTSSRFETADYTCWVWRLWGTTCVSWPHLAREE